MERDAITPLLIAFNEIQNIERTLGKLGWARRIVVAGTHRAPSIKVAEAAKVIENTPELANVTAIKEGNIVYMPADTYVNESIQTYTKFLNDFADALEAAK